MTSPKRKRNMSGYDAAVRALAGMNQGIVNLRNFIQPPTMGAYSLVDEVLDQLRLEHVNVRQALLPPLIDPVAPLKDIILATDHVHDVLAKTSVSMDIGDMVHESWREQVGSLTDLSAQLDAAAKFSLVDTSVQLAKTESFLASVDFDFMKSQFDFQVSLISAVEQSLLDTTASYRALTDSVGDLSRLIELPSFVLPGATICVYSAGLALRALDHWGQPEDEEIEEEIFILPGKYVDNLDIIALLQLVNPKLVALYMGAKEALYSNNPDRKRHALTSLRELCNNVVRAIAPVEQASDWIAEHGKRGDLDCSNRPTRRGKIRYISRNIDSPPMVDFVNQSATMSTRLHDLYGRIHELEPGLTDDQLYTLLWRTESELSYLIRIWLTTAQL